jgi:hypothetical protein
VSLFFASVREQDAPAFEESADEPVTIRFEFVKVRSFNRIELLFVAHFARIAQPLERHGETVLNAVGQMVEEFLRWV